MPTRTDLSAETIIEIPFHDVDMMEIAWHGHYVKYFEIARCKLLDKIEYNYSQMRDSGFDPGYPGLCQSILNFLAERLRDFLWITAQRNAFAIVRLVRKACAQVS